MTTIDQATETYIELINQLESHQLSKVDPEVFVKNSQAAYEVLYAAVKKLMWGGGYYYVERFMGIRDKLNPLIRRAHALRLKYQPEDVAQNNNLGPSVLAHVLMDQLMDVIKSINPDSIAHMTWGIHRPGL